MAANTSHKGKTIIFDEATEQWKCEEFMLADPSLHKLKAAIDAESLKRRRVAVPVLWLHEQWRRSGPNLLKLKEATVVLLRDGDRKADIKVGSEKHHIDMNDLYPVEQRAELLKLVTLKANEAAAVNAVAEQEERISSISAQEVREMAVRLADQEPLAKKKRR